MIKKSLFGFWILIFGFTAIAVAVPQFINYQGMLRNVNGNLQNGTFSMTFKIYAVESGGSALFTHGPVNIQVSNGLYNVQIPGNTSIFDGSNRWLEVTVGSDVLSPRLKINSVAYSLVTEHADYAEVAGTATNAATADFADYATLSGTATSAATATNANAVDGISANLIPSSNQLYPLDSFGILSGVSVSPEAVNSNFALFINGKLGAKFESGAGTVGTPKTSPIGRVSVNSGGTPITIYNTTVTSSSAIIITPLYISPAATDDSFKVTTVNNGNFIVNALDGALNNNADFFYLVIN